MKKILLILGVSITSFVSAQTIVNGAFEDWISISYDEPTGFQTANHEQALRSGILPVNKVAGVTGFAVKLETKLDPLTGDTVGGYVAIGDPNGDGGTPYSQRPTGITGKYIANMSGGDSAIVLVMFKKAGVVISQNFYTLGGKNQTTFSTFSFPIMDALTTDPDSVIIAAASSNLLTNMGVAIGSNIVFDDFSFTGAGITQAIPNGNFDTWVTTTSYKLQDGWDANGNRDGVTKTTDAYRGAAAIKLTTNFDGDGNVYPSQITSGINNQMGPPSNGRPFTNMNDTLIGYYKYSGTNGDSAQVYVSATNSGNFVFGTNLSLEAKSTYTYFEIPISCFATPDSLVISFASSKYPTTASSAGSTLILDEVQLKSAKLTTGLNTSKQSSISYSVYPNPVNNVLNIRLENNVQPILSVQLFDLSGKLVSALSTIEKNLIKIDAEGLNSGVYFYQILTQDGRMIKNKFVKE